MGCAGLREGVRAVFGSVVLSAARAVFAQAAVGVWRLRSVAVVGSRLAV